MSLSPSLPLLYVMRVEDIKKYQSTHFFKLLPLACCTFVLFLLLYHHNEHNLNARRYIATLYAGSATSSDTLQVSLINLLLV